ncbi:NAD(P)/FAD-dependent oxidoreductase [Marinobacter salinisoli]|uniref:NAD(P)/FAD-dependent oxidoreductase n=1 Tax=Marinobacter salinisoli TaxID=2769486 RepID=A0ABX7MSY9_9GAMM|nr:NAD(P)/FAD-dependent oxidoreductase [Marinobacter salinisoli]QSP94565.1 NAD(P)/FAD-dependent oxidoreductase [Marinobacter salinisoli]
MPKERLETQTVVIGAGVVGLAVARRLALAGHDVVVLEGGSRFGEGTSSRSSEVIHAGIYYPAGSLKARLCVRGRDQLYDYCRDHRIAHRQCGKWIVASSACQVESLGAIAPRALDNGVTLYSAEGRELARALPELSVEAALWSPQTGIVDSHGLMLSLVGEIEDAGSRIAFGAPVLEAESSPQGHRLIVGGQMPCELLARNVVNAAGLGAVDLARRWRALPESGRPRQWFARGVYFSYGGKPPTQALVYPVPESGGLGVHLTLDLAGQARFGPDVEWIDELDYTVDPQRVSQFAEGIRRWWPGLDPARLSPAYAGIRPKLHGPDQASADFRIDGPESHGLEGLVNLFGIESPGLTSCLAIADEVSARLC